MQSVSPFSLGQGNLLVVKNIIMLLKAEKDPREDGEVANIFLFRGLDP